MNAVNVRYDTDADSLRLFFQALLVFPPVSYVEIKTKHTLQHSRAHTHIRAHSHKHTTLSKIAGAYEHVHGGGLDSAHDFMYLCIL